MKILFCRYQPFLGLVNTFTPKGFSERSPVMHLKKHIFRSLICSEYWEFHVDTKNLSEITKEVYGILDNILSLSCHEEVCLSGLRFKRYFSHHPRPDDRRSISRNVTNLSILIHDMINLLYYEY